MAIGTAWVDEICASLNLQTVSAWLPWRKREQGDALGIGDEQGAPGVFLIGLGDDEASIEVVYIGSTGRARARLRRLEDQVKWGMNYGFRPLRDLLDRYGDHRTMGRVWVKMIRLDEMALFPSPLLTPRRVNALGVRRRQLETILLAEHYYRFGSPVLGNREMHGLFLRDAPAISEAPPAEPAMAVPPARVAA